MMGILPMQKRAVEVLGVRYGSVAEAAEALNIGRDTVSRRVKSQKAKYREWKYALPRVKWDI